MNYRIIHLAKHIHQSLVHIWKLKSALYQDDDIFRSGEGHSRQPWILNSSREKSSSAAFQPPDFSVEEAQVSEAFCMMSK